MRIDNVSNNIRTHETVTIPITDLKLSLLNCNFTFVNNKSKEEFHTQVVDVDADSIADYILFQPEILPHASVEFTLKLNKNTTQKNKVYSRFVPERTDDYAWENDRVAFRTFGPKAQYLFKSKKKGGTLTSGIDCWLKKVEYPIINKWYQGYLKNPSYYHKDHGEGLDNFHVGRSRGCGGVGVYKNDTLYTSKNFINYQKTTDGPIRTSFNLCYAPWKTPNGKVSLEKNISLDLGSNFTEYLITATGTDFITIGLTLHENDGNIQYNTTNGWFSYWQPHGKSELGMGILINPKDYLNHKITSTNNGKEFQLLVNIKLTDGIAYYAAGFGWKESGQFASEKEWINTLIKQTDQRNKPLTVNLITPENK